MMMIMTCFVEQLQQVLDQRWCLSASLVGVNTAGFQGLPLSHYYDNEERFIMTVIAVTMTLIRKGDDNAPLQVQVRVSVEHIHCQRGSNASKPSSVAPLESLRAKVGCCCCGGGFSLQRDTDVADVVGGEVVRCCRNISAPILMLVSPPCTDLPLLRGSRDELLACKRVLENKIKDEKIKRMLWEP